MRTRATGILGRVLAPALVAVLAGPGPALAGPTSAATGAATGAALGRVVALRKGMPGVADPTWKVRFSPKAGGEPIDVPLHAGVYETPDLPEGAYDVLVVDAFGQPIGNTQVVVIRPGATRVDLQVEMVGSNGGTGTASADRRRFKVVAIVGGAAAALAIAAGGGGGSEPAGSPSTP